MFYLLALLFAAAPTYAIRFNIGIPVNLLELLALAFLLVFAVWLKKNNLVTDFKQHVEGQPRLMLVLAGVLMLAGLISAIIAPDKQRGFGLFIVYFLEPILLYMPASYLLNNTENKLRMIKWIFVLVVIYSLYAIIQYFTSIGLPLAWQGNPVEPRRAISFFSHPNGFSLFLTPLLAFLLPFVFDHKISWFYKVSYILGLVGLLLSLSRGGWLTFVVIAVIYIAFFAKERVRLTGLVAGAVLVLIVTSVPFLQKRAVSVYVGDKSTESRISLWHTGLNMVKTSPILGKGLQGFEANFDKYNTDPTQDKINLAHNVFINFWVETGLLGVIAFVLVSIFALYRAWRTKGLLGAAMILFVLAILIHGQVDNPYMRNDLALEFWLVLAFIS